MSKPPYSDDQLILAARLYYQDGLPQAEIGRFVNVSQAKVSRMLAIARERGLVRITISDYDPRNPELERRLRDELGVDSVVIRSVAGLKIKDLRQATGYFAAPVVSAWLKSTSVVAIAGGRTLQALIEHMKPAEGVRGLTMAQAMGNIDSSTGPYDAVELARTLAHRWQGAFLALNSPAILPDPDTVEKLLGLAQIRRVMESFAHSDLAFVGVGSLENSVFLERNVLSPSDIETLRLAGAVGEILGRFYDADGKECSTPYQRRVISLELDRLRVIPKRVAVVTGSDRAEAALAAIRGGLLNTIVIDEGGANSLLKHEAPASLPDPVGPQSDRA
ncbi:sugar-binding transcriptional regulator [Singulisphaera sp. PoT]|uniref:sugar-binding transcriptional regulator n=1 Tax=Singulisphaera sp. PoT TaxID=3411797 RepID=UPI003BF576CB